MEKTGKVNDIGLHIVSKTCVTSAPVKALASLVSPTDTAVASPPNVRANNWNEADLPPFPSRNTASETWKPPTTNSKASAMSYTADAETHVAKWNLRSAAIANNSANSPGTATVLMVSSTVERLKWWNTVRVDRPLESPHDPKWSRVANATHTKTCVANRDNGPARGRAVDALMDPRWEADKNIKSPRIVEYKETASGAEGRSRPGAEWATIVKVATYLIMSADLLWSPVEIADDAVARYTKPKDKTLASKSVVEWKPCNR